MSSIDRFFLWTERFSDNQLTASWVIATFAGYAAFGVVAWLALR